MVSVPKKLKHIAYFSRNIWGYPIWNAINGAVDSKKIVPLSKEFRNEIGDLVLGVSTRIDCLPIIIERINRNTKKLYAVMQKRDKSKDQYGYQPKDVNLPYELLIDINSFLFEIFAGLELLETMEKGVLRKLLRVRIKDRSIKEILTSAQKSTKWYDFLKRNRDHFSHSGMSWIAVCLDSEPIYDLLILKRNVKTYENPDDYFRLSELVDVLRGFKEAAFAVQDYMVSEIKK